MDKRVINEEQFRKLVIKEAKKILSEEGGLSSINENKTPSPKRKVTFESVESLIKEMKDMNKSISSISLATPEIVEEEVKAKPNRDLDVIEHNKKKNIKHVNEGEKDKWNRMLKYKIPSDDKR